MSTRFRLPRIVLALPGRAVPLPSRAATATICADPASGAGAVGAVCLLVLVAGTGAPLVVWAQSPQAGAPIEARTSPPPERPSLVRLLEPLWIDLTDAQQKALEAFAPEWNSWPTAEKKAWVALADKLPAMSDERRGKAQRRILEWANLSPEQRRVARANYRLAKERPARQRVEEWENYQAMTQEQREVLRRAGSTSNTAAGHAGAATGLAKEASQPLPRVTPPRATFFPATSPGPAASPAR